MNTALVCGAGPLSRKGKSVSENMPFPKLLLNASEEYHALDLVQAHTVWAGWCRHALWIFSRYWRSANPKDLVAFTKHVHGMRIARLADEIKRSAR
jgi:hypothetical protein